MVQLVPFKKFESIFDAEKTPISQISERENRIFWQFAASNHSWNVTGNKFMNFNQVYTKITNFIKNILEVQASVKITDGTICTTVFPHNLKYNTIVQFF